MGRVAFVAVREAGPSALPQAFRAVAAHPRWAAAAAAVVKVDSGQVTAVLELRSKNAAPMSYVQVVAWVRRALAWAVPQAVSSVPVAGVGGRAWAAAWDTV